MFFGYKYDRITNGIIEANYPGKEVGTVNTFLQIVHALLAIGLIAGVLLQSGKSAGLSGSIAGGAETFFGKSKGLDETLSKLTTVAAILFMVSSVVLSFFLGR